MNSWHVFNMTYHISLKCQPRTVSKLNHWPSMNNGKIWWFWLKLQHKIADSSCNGLSVPLNSLFPSIIILKRWFNSAKRQSKIFMLSSRGTKDANTCYQTHRVYISTWSALNIKKANARSLCTQNPKEKANIKYFYPLLEMVSHTRHNHNIGKESIK